MVRGVIPPEKHGRQKWNFLVPGFEAVLIKKSRFTDSQIIAVLKEAEAGTPVQELCRTHGISSTTFYKWRSTFGGMNVSLMTRVKEPE